MKTYRPTCVKRFESASKRLKPPWTLPKDDGYVAITHARCVDREPGTAEVFDLLDVDGLGEIDIDEFCYAFQHLSASSATPDDLRRSKFCASIHSTVSQVPPRVRTRHGLSGLCTEDRRSLF